MDRAVLWDLDGTIVDSAEQHRQSWVEALAAEGLRVTPEQFRATFGQRNDRILETWLGARATPEFIERVGNAKEEAYRRMMRAGRVEPLAGVHAWIDRLHRDGWKQAVASSAPRLNVEAVVDVLDWSRYFGALASGDDVSAGKPDPEIFLLAARRLGVPPVRSVVVEDAAVGVQAARRGGMRSIAVGPAAASHGADISVVSLDRLPADAFERLVPPAV
jgi:beta-phosphoglucomutase